MINHMKPLLMILVACLSHTQHKPHQVVVEVNVTGTTAYNDILSNVVNLKRAFAPEAVRVEVVCHAEGINMLLLSKLKPQSLETMRKLSSAGVEFAACSNTLRMRHIAKSQIVSFAKVVDAGIAEVVRKEEAGWSY